MSDDAPAPGELARYRTFDPPPRDFDLRTATAHALRKHGFPPRPDPRSQPALDRIWQRAAARDLHDIKAQLAFDPATSNRDPRLRPDGGGGASNWAGVYAEVNLAHAARFVFAEWVVPELEDIDPAITRSISAGLWVGIDGISYEPGGLQLLQAGISVDVTSHLPWPFPAGGAVRWSAWTEWWSAAYADTPQAGAATVENFPVSAGDTVSFLVYTDDPTLGFVWVSNLTTGLATRVAVPGLPGIASKGGTVEWIVEAPKTSPLLPKFSPVTFTLCAGGLGISGHGVNVTHGFVVDIDGTNGKLTKTSKTSEDSVTVEWLGWS